MSSNYTKLRIALRYWLLGRNWIRAVDAFEYAATFHVGTRKDKVTPEFKHQVDIGHHVRTLTDSLMFPEATLATVFLHDVPEDYNVAMDIIRKRFGKRIANATWLLTKKHQGMVKDKETYFSEMAECPIASIVKAADRIHNLQSMQGVFAETKQLAYIAEVEKYILPMLKKARRNFPKQELAYENLKQTLQQQIQLVRAIRSAGTETGL